MSSLLGACAWTSLDALAPTPGTVGSQAPPLDAAPETADAVASTDASGATDVATSTAPSTAPCTANVTAAREWDFDSTAEAWSLETDTGVQATLVWSGATGDPNAGALQVDVTPASSDASALTGAWVRFAMSATDLTNRTISAWVWLDSGESPHLKTFVQTGTQYKWADYGTVFVTAHQWTCLTLPVSTPAYNQPDYDPTHAVSLGFEMLGSEPFRVFVDTVRYY